MNKLRTGIRREATRPGPVTIYVGPLPLHDGGGRGRPAARIVTGAAARIIPAPPAAPVPDTFADLVADPVDFDWRI
jgi:hypothetical protein